MSDSQDTTSSTISGSGFELVQQQSVTQRTKLSIVTTLYRQSYRVAISNPIAASIMVFWLSNVASLNELLIWIGCICFMSVCRVIAHQCFVKRSDRQNTALWLHVWAGLSALTATIYAIGFVYFVPFEQPQYVIAVGLFIVCLSSVALLACSASAYSVLSFFVPMALIPSFHIYAQGGEMGVMVLMAMGLYAVLFLTLIKNIGETFKNAIVFSYQHQLEIDKRKLLEKQLQDISRRDGLTGLFNRRYFDETLEVEIGRAHRTHGSLCLIIFEVDYFKEYNQHYGHVAGDNCLVAVADIAADLANRNGDLVARYDSEQFAVILPNIDIKGATAFAQKLQHSVQKKRIKHETTHLSALKSVTVSIGVTNLTPFSKTTPSELIKQADDALFEAKRQGRNRVHFNENNGLGHHTSL